MQQNEPKGHLRFLQNPWVVYALLAMISLSLLLHLITWLAINRLRGIAREQIQALAQEIEQAENDVFTMNLELNQPVPIRAAIPINQQLTIPINTTVALSETFNVPLDTPLGSFNIPVPINADIPINTEVPISVRETVSVSTTVDLDLDVPISVPIRETSLASYLKDLRQKLVELGESL